MRPRIRSGRCWVPQEWRVPLGMRFYQRTALIAVAGVQDKNDAFGLLADHLPLLPADDESPDEEPVPDVLSARRMARRLSRHRFAAGAKELISAGYLPHHIPAVYAWRAASHGEHAFRVSPDGRFAPVAIFRAVRNENTSGRWEDRLTASRPWLSRTETRHGNQAQNPQARAGPAASPATPRPTDP